MGPIQLFDCNSKKLSPIVMTFLPNVATALHSSAIVMDGMLSGCLSVTRVYCDEKAEAEITRFLFLISEMSLLSAW